MNNYELLRTPENNDVKDIYHRSKRITDKSRAKATLHRIAGPPTSNERERRASQATPTMTMTNGIQRSNNQYLLRIHPMR